MKGKKKLKSTQKKTKWKKDFKCCFAIIGYTFYKHTLYFVSILLRI